MKKFILFIMTIALCSQVFASQKYDAQNENENEAIFLSLTKFAEPLKDLTTNLTVITQKEIEEKNATNLGEILEGELGISFKANGPLGQAPSIFIRGAKSEATLVLIDGRVVNEPGLGGANFTSIPASMIEKVEIIRGSGCAVYGTGAFGGVINVITKTATPITRNFNPYFSYGTFQTINAGITGAYANDIISLIVAPSLLSSDGYSPCSFYNSKNIFSKFVLKTTEKSEFILSGQAYNADIGNPGALSNPDWTSKQFDDSNFFRIDYNTEINNFEIKTFAYNSNATRESWGKYYTAENGLKANILYENLIFAGLEYNKTTYEDKGSFAKSREKTGGYLQSFLNINDLTLIPAVRYEINTDYNDVCTPALSVVYKLTDEFKFSGNISKLWNAPTFNQLYYPIDPYGYHGNPNLKPEEGISSDIGIAYLINNFSISLTGFYITAKNLIEWNSDITPSNLDESQQYGYELGINYNMFKMIRHDLNYTYLRAEDTKTHQDLFYRPMHTLNYALTIKPTASLKLTADTSYVAKTRYITGGAFLKDYFIVNIKADYKLTSNISVWAQCRNLTNEKYQLAYDYPMPGITGYSGVDIKF